MLDFNINVELKPELAVPFKGKEDRLLITSCAVHMFGDDRIWSGFDEEAYNCLNHNDYGYGVVDFEIGLSGYTKSAYPKVYTKCFFLLTDNGLKIKPKKFSNIPSESKINQRGETVIGIRYYFTQEEEIQTLVNSGKLMFECFFALDNPKNTYALMCQLKIKGGKWIAEAANTYKPPHAKNIKHLID